MLLHPPGDKLATDGPKPPLLKRFWTWVVGIAAVFAVFYYLVWGLGRLERLQLFFSQLSFKDGHVTWRVPLLTFLVGVLAATVSFLTLCRRARRKGDGEGFLRGEKQGIVKGNRVGIDSGRKAGIEEGTRAGFDAGHAAGLEAGRSAGKQEGTEEGFRRGELSARNSLDFQLTVPFAESSVALHKTLSSAGLGQSAINIIGEYAHLVNDWSWAITSLDLTRDQSSGAELTLGAATLQKYLEQLRMQRHPPTTKPLLPANYEIYAWCVARVLDRMTEMGSSDGRTIRVWTHFKKDLRRWYNIGWWQGNPAHSHPWWEKYKDTVISIKRPQSIGSVQHSIQMRRLVTTDIDSARRYLVYVPDTAAPLTIAKAIKQFKYHRGCPTISAEILAAFELPGMFSALPIHVIGECKCSQGGHSGWQTLKDNFDGVYHDLVFSKDVEFSDQDKGVYCAYAAPISADYSYDDIFLVDMSALNQGLFGIAYYASPAGELDGIVILADDQIRNLIDGFYAPAWKRAGEV